MEIFSCIGDNKEYGLLVVMPCIFERVLHFTGTCHLQLHRVEE
jgi:hypothetical protein